jgi:hypothetical protein
LGFDEELCALQILNPLFPAVAMGAPWTEGIRLPCWTLKSLILGMTPHHARNAAGAAMPLDLERIKRCLFTADWP